MSNTETKAYYQHHVFFCLNQREEGERTCCAGKQAKAMQDHMKKRVKALGKSGPGQVRVNKAGCLERCEEGPCLVVYPQGTWYTYIDQVDIDEIVDSHLVNNQPVSRLMI